MIKKTEEEFFNGLTTGHMTVNGKMENSMGEENI